MNSAVARFELEEEISLSGRPVRVAGFVRFEDADGQVATRYLLNDPEGPPVILEETGGQFAVLRPFPPTAQPQARRGTIAVMGAKYALAGVRKRKVLGSGGQPPGGAPKSDLVLSGLFEGEMGALLRELAPGAGSQQVFYFFKPVEADLVLTDAQREVMLESRRLAAEARARVEDEENALGGSDAAVKTVLWVAAAAVIAALGYACSTADDDGMPAYTPGFTSERR